MGSAVSVPVPVSVSVSVPVCELVRMPVGRIVRRLEGMLRDSLKSPDGSSLSRRLVGISVGISLRLLIPDGCALTMLSIMDVGMPVKVVSLPSKVVLPSRLALVAFGNALPLLLPL